MNKRNLLIAIPALCSGYLHGQTQPASPNVIYILMDDLGYGDIGCFGQDKIETPHIDRLCKMCIRDSSYTLPKVWSQRLYFDDVKVFFSGENLYTWDHLPKGLETDMLSKGAWEYPFMRKFSFGINVTF